jgi:transposase InsO family protein
MDFIVQLPHSNGFDAIITFTCLYTKQVHCVPTTTKVTAQQVAKLYLHNIYQLHGLSKVFVSDRDSKFTSEFWGSFTRLMGTKLNMSTAYHAQTDGQAERTNQTAEQVLRSYCFQRHDTWADYLDTVEFCMNLHRSSSTCFSPFQAVYGFQPDTVGTLIASEHPGTADQLLATRQAIHKLITANLEDAKQFQQHYANQRVRDIELNVGDRVAIHTKGISMPGQPGKAFKQRYIGPYSIIEKLSPLVYKLRLPPAMKLVHPVIHISRLRLWNDDGLDQARVVTEAHSGQFADLAKGEFVVDSILKAKVAPHSRYALGDTLQFKVRWQGYEQTHDTWEPYVFLKNVEQLDEFMNSPAWQALRETPAYADLVSRWPARVPITDRSSSRRASVKTKDFPSTRQSSRKKRRVT